MTESREFPNLIIRASAGTGKTFQLSNRYLGLLSSGGAGDDILATTFTRKAAGEILDRVVVRLAEAVLDDTACTDLASHTKDQSITREKCSLMLQTTMRNLHRLHIGTLDSFFAQIARSLTLELGMPPGWRIVEELDDAALRTEAIDAVLRQEKTQDLVTLMNLMTKGEASRGVSQLVHETVSDLYGLFQETDAGAWSRIPRYKPLKDDELADTVEDLRTVEIPDKELAKARDVDYSSVVVGDWMTFISKGLAAKALDGSYEYNRKAIPDEAKAIYNRLLGHVRSEVIGRVAMQTQATFDLLERFDAQYQQLKQQQGALRFDDITHALASSLQQRSFDSRHLVFRLDGRIDHLLLDEFQDTSPAQWQAIRPFAERVTRARSGSPDPAESSTEGLKTPGRPSVRTVARSGDRPQQVGDRPQQVGDGSQRSFFCVGDVKQAIYGWRGGVAEIFDAISEQLPDLVPEALNTSYRSSQVVIDTTNKIFSGITNHPNLKRTETAVQNWRKRFTQHQTARRELPGYTCLVTAPAASEDQDTGEITLTFAASRIAEIVAQSPGHNVGVLVRKNETVGKLIYLLRKNEVHASEEGGNPLTDSAAVMVILSLLRLADHPGDTVARFHVTNSPLATTVGLLDHRDAAAAVCLSQSVRRALIDDGFGPTIFGWVKTFAPQCNRRELNRLDQLVELAYGYQSRATLRVDDFIRAVETKNVSDVTAADVRVMTIHQAKGLEFDIVVLPELDFSLTGQTKSFVVERKSPTSPVTRVCRYIASDAQKLLPADLQKVFDHATLREVNESLCVLYVAVTRAIHALHMIISPSAPNERSLPKSFAGLLRAALSNDQPVDQSVTIFQHGDPHWHQLRRAEKPIGQLELFDKLDFHTSPTRQRGTKEPASFLAGASGLSAPRQPSPESASKPSRIILAPITGPRHRGLNRTSPSNLEGGSLVRLKDVFNRAGSSARQRGTLIHAWFEQIEWLNDGRPDDATLRQVANELPGISFDDSELQELITKFHAMLDQPAIAGALSREGYAATGDRNVVLRVENEKRIVHRDGEYLISGTIDRLVLSERGNTIYAADIIDFKTDHLEANDQHSIQEKTDYYRPQIESYRRSVAKIFGLSPAQVAARLLFVAIGRAEQL